MSELGKQRTGSSMLLCVELEGAEFPEALLKQLPVRRVWLRAVDAQHAPIVWRQLDERLGELLGPAATLGRLPLLRASMGTFGGQAAKATAPALRLIEECYTEKLSVARLAAACSMTAVTFARRFKHENGITVASFMCAYRLARARELLGRSNMAIKEVAMRVGFEDVAYFCRAFKRNQGMTPRTYRRLCGVAAPLRSPSHASPVEASL